MIEFIVYYIGPCLFLYFIASWVSLILGSRSRVRVFFAWYDFWIGIFFDRKKKLIYLIFIPTLVMVLSYEETDLSKVLVPWLQDQEWEVYQEVQIRTYGKVIDLVCVRGNLVWAIELKTSFTFTVLEQAYDHVVRRNAHFISVCVPATKSGRGGRFLTSVMQSHNLGLLEIKFEKIGKLTRVYETIKPGILKIPTAETVYPYLNEKQKTYAMAGNSNGKRWTPFQQTKVDLINFVRKHQGCTFKQAINSINHHYATNKAAIATLSSWIRQGVIKEIKTQKVGRVLKLYVD